MYIPYNNTYNRNVTRYVNMNQYSRFGAALFPSGCSF